MNVFERLLNICSTFGEFWGRKMASRRLRNHFGSSFGLTKWVCGWRFLFEGSPAAMARFLHCCRQQIDSVSSCYRAELDLEGGDDPKRLSVTLQSIPGCQNLEFPCARFDNLKWRQLPIMLVLGSRCRCRSFNLLSDVCGIQRGHGRATHRRRQPAETGSNWCQRTGLHNRQYHGLGVGICYHRDATYHAGVGRYLHDVCLRSQQSQDKANNESDMAIGSDHPAFSIAPCYQKLIYYACSGF